MLKRFGMVASVLALLAVALAGCKNGMLGEDEATVNGRRDAGNRTAFVTVTNFAADAGRQRTIAPDTPDVKTGYKFIAEGKSGRNVLEAKVVTIDPATGRVDLADLPPGLWSITLTAYDENKLGGDTDAAAIVAKKDTAAVLSGTATVDLTRNSGDVLITLTPRNVGTEGTVNLTVVFDANDQREIAGKTKGEYTVKIGLFNRATGEVIEANGMSSETEVTNMVEAGTNVTYQLTKVPVGEYTFRVTITETTTGKNGPWYYTDNLFVHGNMDTRQTVNLPELLGGAIPADPTDFAVYWSDGDATKYKADGSEYTVHFAWNRKSFNESGFELQIADITEHFTPANNQYDGDNADSAANLWGAIDAKAHNNVTTFTEKDFSSLAYPIYDKQGSLIAGSTYVDYVLPTGRLYTARIRARNSNGNSNWVYLNDGTDPASRWQDAGVPPAIAVTGAKKLESYYFDVFSVTYQLGNAILLKEGDQATAAVKGDVALHAYKQGTPYTVKYEVSTAAGDGKYQLYPASFAGTAAFDTAQERIKSWSGWKNVTDRADVQVYNTGVNYDKFTNVTLVPAGASGGLLADVITAGTFKDLLSGTTVFIQLKEETGGQVAPQGQLTWTGKGWDAVTTDIKAAGNSEVGVVNGKKGIRLPDTIQTNVKDYLCVAVGKNDTALGTLTITTAQFPAGRDIDVYTMKLTLEQNGTVIASGVSNPGDDYVYCDVTTLSEGDYTLRLMVTPMEGYDFSFQKQIVVKCESTVIP